VCSFSHDGVLVGGEEGAFTRPIGNHFVFFALEALYSFQKNKEEKTHFSTQTEELSSYSCEIFDKSNSDRHEGEGPAKYVDGATCKLFPLHFAFSMPARQPRRGPITRSSNLDDAFGNEKFGKNGR